MANQQKTRLDSAAQREPAAIVREYLVVGEKLIWVEQPDPDGYAQRHNGYSHIEILLFAPFLWLPLGLFIMVAIVFNNWACMVMLLLVVALFVGLQIYRIEKIKQDKRREAREIIYALTNQRLLTLSINTPIPLQTYPLTTVCEIKVEHKTKTIGNVFFQKVHYTNLDGNVTPIYTGFEVVPRAAWVADQIHQQVYNR